MCIHCVNSYVRWNEENIGRVSTAPLLARMAFVASNVLFFCGGPSLAGIGAVSVIFHGYQCIQDDRYTCWLMWLDTVATTLAAIVFVLRSAHNVTVLWCLLWVPTVLLYAMGSGKLGQSRYMTMHGAWHLCAGGLLLALQD